MGGIHKLSAKTVQNEKRPGRYGDGGGLWLQVAEKGGKSWVLRYHWAGKEKVMGLGPVSTVSLAEAREKAMAARKLVAAGTDPLAEKRAQEAARAVAAARVMTLRDCAAAYIDSHSDSWRNAKHRKQWESTLATYAFPLIGDLPVADIDKGLVLRVLGPIWKDKTVTASRVRMRLEAVLAWATAAGYRHGDNPARWKGHLEQLLPAPRKVAPVKHHAALPFRDMPAFMADLRSREGSAARALEFLILTALRTNEVTGARPEEFDLDRRIWTVPAERMKSKKVHRVALSERAVELVKSSAGRGPFIFEGNRPGTKLGDRALDALTARMNWKGVTTVHGLRSTFRDWGTEQTSYPDELLEMTLAHIVTDKTKAAYQRGDMLEKRFRLAEDWARYCSGPAITGDVVPLRPAAQRDS
jgi:integrase